MIGVEEQTEFFKLIGSELKKKVECLVVGGSAMMFYGIKTATKDIDIVFISKKEREMFISSLRKLGFEGKFYGKAAIMARKDTRFDLFLGEVIKFKISPGILSRIREVHEFHNLFIKVASPEDIILLKCATDREGDRIDAKSLIEKFEINWKVIMEEVLWQMQNGKRIFSLFLYDFLLDLKERKSDIPKDVLKELKGISEREMEKLK